MANTSAVYARIDSGLKENAEAILAQLGITPSSAIQMFYRQVVLTQGLPLDLHLPASQPTCIGGMDAGGNPKRAGFSGAGILYTGTGGCDAP